MKANDAWNTVKSLFTGIVIGQIVAFNIHAYQANKSIKELQEQVKQLQGEINADGN